MTEPRVTPGLETSPIFQVRGQRSRWRYPHDRLTPEHCRVLENCNLSERGTAARRKGHTKWNSTAAALSEAIVGLFQRSWDGGGQNELVITPLKVYVDDGTTQTDITNAMAMTGTDEDRFIGAFVQNKLILSNGVDASIVKDNDFSTPTMDALTGMQWTVCLGFLAHKSVLVAFKTTEDGTSFPNRLRWSDVDAKTFTADITTWPPLNVFDLDEGEVGIVGGVSNWSRIFIFKPDGVRAGKLVTRVGRNEIVFDEAELLGFSPISKHLVARPEFIAGVAREGMFVIRPDMQTFEIVTKDITEAWEALDKARLKYAIPYVEEKDHQVRCMVASTTISNGFDKEVIWDWETGDAWIDNVGTEFRFNVAAPQGIELSGVQSAWKGSYNKGYTYRGAVGTTDDGTEHDFIIHMEENDLGFSGKTKTIINFRTIYRGKVGTQTITLDLFLDRGILETSQDTLSLGTSLKYNAGNKYNSGLSWPGGANQRADSFINRQCVTLSPRWTGTNDFELVGYQVEFQLEE